MNASLSTDNTLLRLSQIVGDPKASPPIPPIIPICKTSWWNGVKSGKYPQPIKLGPRTTCWRKSEVLALLNKNQEGGDNSVTN
ncbi:helix-turn-helix transcriptional regulator [Geomonas ferrireducens]|uniref:helix-turn-helix transcriptional regulator n=1 Tax=Geomonas ferrireducens TaxID=2570227 RepID=UPI0010A7F999|nr:AlpA family phage regulatory protein [Geomonas ferrireducens]